jgi:hypothetical protein
MGDKSGPAGQHPLRPYEGIEYRYSRLFTDGRLIYSLGRFGSFTAFTAEAQPKVVADVRLKVDEMQINPIHGSAFPHDQRLYVRCYRELICIGPPPSR